MDKITTAGPEVHMFICTRTKDKGACCGPKGAAALRDTLKQWVKEQGLNKRVKVTASLCLGHCETGITVCVHPHNEWLINVNAETDLENLKTLLLEKVK